MVASAQGLDISHYQGAYTAAQMGAYSFMFFKASEGGGMGDATFAENWATAKAAGIHRGAYHELVPPQSASAAAQAAHFAATVKAQGVEPGDMLAVVASDYSGVTGAEVLEVLNALKAEFPHCPVLIYSDMNSLGGLEACRGFPLWLADYTGAWPATPGWDAKFWQWSDGGGQLDHDAYNGTAADLAAWLATFAPTAPPPPPPPPTYPVPTGLSAKTSETVKLAWKGSGPHWRYQVRNAAGTVILQGVTTVPYVNLVLPGPGKYEWHVQAAGNSPFTNWELFEA